MDNYKDHKFIVFAISHYNPLGVIRALGFDGIRPDFIALDGRSDVAKYSRFINICHEVTDEKEGYKVLIENYGHIFKETGKKPFILCCDDKGIGYLDLHYNELKDKFILYNAGVQGRISEFMDKFNILECAKRHGLNVLDTRVVRRGEDPGNITYPIITKSISPNAGGWKSDVFICGNWDELKEAYSKIKSEDVVIQTYIEKENEYCIEGCSVDKGRSVLYTIDSTYKYIIKGYYSPFRLSQTFDNPELKRKLDSMMEEIGFEGIFDVEFLIAKDGTLWFLEVNWRHTAWGYASYVAGMSLPVIWAKSMLNGKIIDGARKMTKQFKAIVEPIDYKLRVKDRGMNRIKWVLQMLSCKSKDYFNLKDIKPSWFAIKNWSKLG